MEGIGRFLQRFQKILKGAGAEQSAVATALQTVLGVSVRPEDISIRDGVAHTRLHSTARAELNIKKSEVLQAIRDRGVTAITDIR